MGTPVPSAEDTLLASAPLLETFAGQRFLTCMVSGVSRCEPDDEATEESRRKCGGETRNKGEMSTR